MRIIGGDLGGRVLATPRDLRTRPMLERTRAAVFSMLGEAVTGARVLDLYSGTGSLGIEALSRGAAEALFVERDPGALACLVRNLETLALGARSAVRRGSVDRVVAALDDASRDLVFLDPPYREAEEERRRGALLALARDLAERVLAPGGTLVLHFPEGALSEQDLARLAPRTVRDYGRNAVALVERAPA